LVLKEERHNLENLLEQHSGDCFALDKLLLQIDEISKKEIDLLSALNNFWRTGR